jgi:hypothetical protein
MNAVVNVLFGLLGIAIMYVSEWVKEGKTFSLKAHTADAILSVTVICIAAYFFRAANLSSWFFHGVFVVAGALAKYGVSWIVAKTQGK